ncbi:MOB kinase activator 1B [Entomophthora muscae]|uniref:MOB kinase activator 1B n=1 Tax=Entomophthora muscae TaxID=34485 RepID=A0ACC2TZ11_9FUNG|nr:MOB kinase activator 1B [Entomophthora muscae]
MSHLHPISKTLKTFKSSNLVTGSSSGFLSKQSKLKRYAEATLGPQYLRAAVTLPKGEDLLEWIAMNIVDFFNQINLLYGTVSEFCTSQSCPIMSAGTKYTYQWADESTGGKAHALPAPIYIDKLMSWVQSQLDNERLFPTKTGIAFGKNFLPAVKIMFRRLFRVYAHLYHHHFDHLYALNQELHLNTSFKHFIFLVQEFNLIDNYAKEVAPMQDLIATFEGSLPGR